MPGRKDYTRDGYGHARTAVAQQLKDDTMRLTAADFTNLPAASFAEPERKFL
jgi:hypothetical protein